ncbi:MAG: ribonuclease P protein component [Methylomonas sp.]|nr:ribonuclease P protein component [Methylomonas sp.]PPD22574.1 MAG: ribonuclease P protein component [Methylomonas sp.]PPD27885.1 MAG: ribonuclease P protein component [Methylomonas sp.]PPD38084.1 MAG: ribonuclease P protein component [Methylomonas sp.]PPD39995.1 MAG: ribonuclease P protein component [Methylomonas sp.]
MAAKPFGFPVEHRLRTPADYKRVFSNPVKVSDRYFTVLATSSPASQSRLGLAIAKKSIKKAVERNRIKRTVRESFRQQQIINNRDIVVLARSDAAKATASNLRASLERHWLELANRCDSCS